MLISFDDRWKLRAMLRLFAQVKTAQLTRTQAAHLLNDYGVPRLLGRLNAAWDVSATSLARIDEQWRSRIKKLLDLPRYVNDGAFYLPLSKGGLGFRSIAHEIRNARIKAIRAVLNKYGNQVDMEKELKSLDMGSNSISIDIRKNEERRELICHDSFAEDCLKHWKATTTQGTGIECFAGGKFDRSLITFRYRQGYHSSYVEQVKLRLQLLEVGT
ncbi:hypothetical protein ACOME3_010487 [Neoechinorhynchus agilis]